MSYNPFRPDDAPDLSEDVARHHALTAPDSRLHRRKYRARLKLYEDDEPGAFERGMALTEFQEPEGK